MKWMIAIVAVMVLATGAQAQENIGSWYLGGNISSWSDTDTTLGASPVSIDTGSGYGFMVGYEQGPWRVAFEYGGLSPDITVFALTAGADINTYMATATWSTPTGMKDLDLYLGAGIGIQDVSSGGVSDNGITTLFRVGVEYSMEQHRIGFGYKHQLFDDIDFGGGAVYDATSAGALEISYRIVF